MAIDSASARPTSAVRMPYLDGALLVVRGLGGRGPLAVDTSPTVCPASALKRLRRQQASARIRLAIGLLVLALGGVLGFAPLPVTSLFVIGIGLVLIGMVSSAFDLVVLLRLRRATAAARFGGSVAAGR